ncbi:unnamed protein product, partial [Nesidiocoris tenuis]
QSTGAIMYDVQHIRRDFTQYGRGFNSAKGRLCPISTRIGRAVFEHADPRLTTQKSSNVGYLKAVESSSFADEESRRASFMCPSLSPSLQLGLRLTQLATSNMRFGDSSAANGVHTAYRLYKNSFFKLLKGYQERSVFVKFQDIAASANKVPAVEKLRMIPKTNVFFMVFKSRSLIWFSPRRPVTLFSRNFDYSQCSFQRRNFTSECDRPLRLISAEAVPEQCRKVNKEWRVDYLGRYCTVFVRAEDSHSVENKPSKKERCPLILVGRALIHHTNMSFVACPGRKILEKNRELKESKRQEKTMINRAGAEHNRRTTLATKSPPIWNDSICDKSGKEFWNACRRRRKWSCGVSVCIMSWSVGGRVNATRGSSTKTSRFSYAYKLHVKKHWMARGPITAVQPLITTEHPQGGLPLGLKLLPVKRRPCESSRISRYGEQATEGNPLEARRPRQVAVERFIIYPREGSSLEGSAQFSRRIVWTVDRLERHYQSPQHLSRRRPFAVDSWHHAFAPTGQHMVFLVYCGRRVFIRVFIGLPFSRQYRGRECSSITFTQCESSPVDKIYQLLILKITNSLIIINVFNVCTYLRCWRLLYAGDGIDLLVFFKVDLEGFYWECGKPDWTSALPSVIVTSNPTCVTIFGNVVQVSSSSAAIGAIQGASCLNCQGPGGNSTINLSKTTLLIIRCLYKTVLARKTSHYSTCTVYAFSQRRCARAERSFPCRRSDFRSNFGSFLARGK